MTKKATGDESRADTNYSVDYTVDDPRRNVDDSVDDADQVESYSGLPDVREGATGGHEAGNRGAKKRQQGPPSVLHIDFVVDGSV